MMQSNCDEGAHVVSAAENGDFRIHLFIYLFPLLAVCCALQLSASMQAVFWLLICSRSAGIAGCFGMTSLGFGVTWLAELQGGSWSARPSCVLKTKQDTLRLVSAKTQRTWCLLLHNIKITDYICYTVTELNAHKRLVSPIVNDKDRCSCPCWSHVWAVM